SGDSVSGRLSREALGDFGARLLVCVLFLLLTAKLWADFVATRRFTGLLFLASEGLVAVLTLLRRRTQVVDRSFSSATLTTLSLLGPPMVRPGGGESLVPDLVTVAVSTVGV